MSKFITNLVDYVEVHKQLSYEEQAILSDAEDVLEKYGLYIRTVHKYPTKEYFINN